jgi:hypothetical protein
MDMCFSTTASFTLGTILLPLGGWCIQKAWTSDRRFLPLAAFPLAFGTQQLIEGLVWLGMNSHDPGLTSQAAIGFVFFSHGFWLFWTPFMVAVLEERPRVRSVWLALTVVGLLLGAYFLMPLLVHQDWLMVGIHQRSLNYSLQVLLPSPVLAVLGRSLYVVTILAPLLLTQNAAVRGLGWLILGSLGLTLYLFSYGFVSIWCYFAAVTSMYVAYLFAQGIESEVSSASVQES